jgi:hypothetical protein
MALLEGGILDRGRNHCNLRRDSREHQEGADLNTVLLKVSSFDLFSLTTNQDFIGTHVGI